VIRVAIPIDAATVALADSDAFALATPLRVDELIELAVRESCGPRAPIEKRDRAVRTTLDGFAAGEFLVAVNGRVFDSAESVVVCSNVARVRFFSPERRLQRT